MKAILIVDLDDDVKLEDTVILYVVRNCYTGYAYKKEVEGVDLKPMPNRIDWLKNGYNGGWIMFSTGWNACIEELEK